MLFFYKLTVATVARSSMSNTIDSDSLLLFLWSLLFFLENLSFLRSIRLSGLFDLLKKLNELNDER